MDVQSRMEFLDDGHIRKDPDTAHQEAHDPEGEQYIPDTCWQCFTQSVAKKAAEEAQK